MQKPHTILSKRGNFYRFTLFFAAVVCGLSPVAMAGQAEDYLNAWSFRDFPTMYSMLRPSDRPESEQAFARAAAESVPVESPSIVQERTSGPVQLIYFHYTDAKTHEKENSSIEVFPDGIRHSDLMTKASVPVSINLSPDAFSQSPGAVSGNPGSSGTVSTVSTGGVPRRAPSISLLPANARPAPSGAVVTASQVMKNMEQATSGVKNFTARINMKGNVMGQNLNETGSLVFMGPDSFRINTEMFIVNSHHGRTTLYMPQMKASMDISSAVAGEIAPGLSGFLGSANPSKAKILETGTESGIPTYRLEIQDSGNSSGLGGSSLLSQLGGPEMNSPMIVTVNSRTWLPMHATKAGVTITYSDYQFNRPDINDGAFQLNLPVSAKQYSLDSLLGM